MTLPKDKMKQLKHEHIESMKIAVESQGGLQPSFFVPYYSVNSPR